MFVLQVEIPGQSRPITCSTELIDLDVGDRLLVEHDKRTIFARVSRVPLDVEWVGSPPPGKVMRRATRADEERESHLEARREEWLELAKQRVREYELPMRLLRADVQSSGKKVTFQFIAEGRVDFRALVRDLARRLRTRVELRQIGVRDATVLQGGIGHCGQELCCARFLKGFAPVSMRMAKAQGLPLNPAKISGQCGRLMCCLRYELDESAQGGRSGARRDRRGRGGKGCRGCSPGGDAPRKAENGAKAETAPKPENAPQGKPESPADTQEARDAKTSRPASESAPRDGEKRGRRSDRREGRRRDGGRGRRGRDGRGGEGRGGEGRGGESRGGEAKGGEGRGRGGERRGGSRRDRTDGPRDGRRSRGPEGEKPRTPETTPSPEPKKPPEQD